MTDCLTERQKGRKAERQKAEGRRQKAEGRRQKATVIAAAEGRWRRLRLFTLYVNKSENAEGAE